MSPTVQCTNGFKVTAYFVDDPAPLPPPEEVDPGRHYKVYFRRSDFDTVLRQAEGSAYAPPMVFVWFDDEGRPTSGGIGVSHRPRQPEAAEAEAARRGSTPRVEGAPGGSLRVVARMVARPEAVEEVRSVLTGLVAPTRAEPGCVVYDLLQNNADPTDFTFVEEWESDEALDAHLSSEHVRGALSRLPALLAAEPDIRRYAPVG